MSQYRNNMNDAGYYTARQICERHPLITELFAWTPRELGQLARFNVIKHRITNSDTYILESELLQLAKFIIKQQERRQTITLQTIQL